jgi:guanylate kinase
MISQPRMGQLYLLVGPPGVGKNTLMKIVLDRFGDIHQLPTATTRAPRPGEQEGREHYFISHESFRQWIADNRLIEYQVVHSGNYYGTPRHTVEDSIQQRHDRIADIEVLGANQLRQAYPDNTVLIFIQPPNRDDLIERMRSRAENEASIADRMKRVDMEMAYAPLCDYLITNDDLDHAAEQLTGIIHAERSRRDLLNLRVNRGMSRSPYQQQVTLLLTDHDGKVVQNKDGMLPSAQVAAEESPADAARRALQFVTVDVDLHDLMLENTRLDNSGAIERVTFEFSGDAPGADSLLGDWHLVAPRHSVSSAQGHPATETEHAATPLMEPAL